MSFIVREPDVGGWSSGWVCVPSPVKPGPGQRGAQVALYSSSQITPVMEDRPLIISVSKIIFL